MTLGKGREKGRREASKRTREFRGNQDKGLEKGMAERSGEGERCRKMLQGKERDTGKEGGNGRDGKMQGVKTCQEKGERKDGVVRREANDAKDTVR